MIDDPSRGKPSLSTEFAGGGREGGWRSGGDGNPG